MLKAQGCVQNEENVTNEKQDEEQGGRDALAHVLPENLEQPKRKDDSRYESGESPLVASSIFGVLSQQPFVCRVVNLETLRFWKAFQTLCCGEGFEFHDGTISRIWSSVGLLLHLVLRVLAKERQMPSLP